MQQESHRRAAAAARRYHQHGAPRASELLPQRSQDHSHRAAPSGARQDAYGGLEKGEYDSSARRDSSDLPSSSSIGVRRSHSSTHLHGHTSTIRGCDEQQDGHGSARYSSHYTHHTGHDSNGVVIRRTSSSSNLAQDTTLRDQFGAGHAKGALPEIDREREMGALRAARRILEARMKQLMELDADEEAGPEVNSLAATELSVAQNYTGQSYQGGDHDSMGSTAAAAATRAQLVSSARHAASAAALAMAEIRMHIEQAISGLRRRTAYGQTPTEQPEQQAAGSQSPDPSDSSPDSHSTAGANEHDHTGSGAVYRGPLGSSHSDKSKHPSSDSEAVIRAEDSAQRAVQSALAEARLAAADAMAALDSARRTAAAVGSSLGAIAGEAARRLRKAAMEEAFGSEAAGSSGGGMHGRYASELLQSAVSAAGEGEGEGSDDGLFVPLESGDAAQQQSLIEAAIESAFVRMQRAADPQAGYIARELRLATGKEIDQFRGSGRHDEPPRSVRDRSMLPGAAGLLAELEADPEESGSPIVSIDSGAQGAAARFAGAIESAGREAPSHDDEEDENGQTDREQSSASRYDGRSEVAGEDDEEQSAVSLAPEALQAAEHVPDAETSEMKASEELERKSDEAWWPFNRDGPMRGVQARVVHGIQQIRARMTPKLGPKGADPAALNGPVDGHSSEGKDMGMDEMSRQLRDLVVVKMVPVADVNEATLAAEEARELRRLEHRHVVRSYDDFLHFEYRSTLVSRILGSKLGSRLDRFGRQLKLLPGQDASEMGLEARLQQLAREARAQRDGNAGHFRSEEAESTGDGKGGSNTSGNGTAPSSVSSSGGLEDVQLYVCIVMEYCPVAADALVRYAREPRRRLSMGGAGAAGSSESTAPRGLAAAQGLGTGVVHPLPERRVARLLREAALGLAYSHSKQCLHRDVKLENLFFGQDGKVRVGDFGLAKRLQRGPVTRLSAAGTAPYKSPEQLLGQPRDGRAADVFALGVCAHELLTLCFVWETWPPADVLAREQEARKYEEAQDRDMEKVRPGADASGAHKGRPPSTAPIIGDHVEGEAGRGRVDGPGSAVPVSEGDLGEMEGTLAARLLHRPAEALEEFVGRVGRRWRHLSSAGGQQPQGASSGSGTSAGPCLDDQATEWPYSRRLLRLIRAMLDPEPQKRPSAEEAARRLLTIETAAAVAQS